MIVVDADGLLPPTCLVMRMKLKNEWDTLAIERGLKNGASNVIVDDVLLYGRTDEQLLAYFRTVLDFLKHHHATLKLKKYKWFQDKYKFVGMYVAAVITQHTQSKNEDFTS